LLFGTHRICPDLAAQEYSEYDDNSDQFLNQLFEFPIGNIDIGPMRLAETPLASYESVTTNSTSPYDLVSGNVDSIQAGEFGIVEGETSEFVRTTEDDTTFIAVDLVSIHYMANDDGTLSGLGNSFIIQYRPASGGAWRTLARPVIMSPGGSESRNAVRRSYKSVRLSPRAWQVRVQFISQSSADADTTRITQRALVAGIRAYQDEDADFSGRNPLAMRIKASGQLYGRVERLNAEVSHRIPNWNGLNWGTVEVTANPASILLWWFRGYYVEGVLRAGYGLQIEEIDYESLQQWHGFCETENLECNIVITESSAEDEIAMLIAQC